MNREPTQPPPEEDLPDTGAGPEPEAEEALPTPPLDLGETAPGALLHVNPAYIPRNHRIEAAIAAAQERDDFGPFEELLAVLAEPFVEHPGYADYENPPKPEERVLRTFCGT